MFDIEITVFRLDREKIRKTFIEITTALNHDVSFAKNKILAEIF